VPELREQSTATRSRLEIRFGFSSERGPRDENQDFGGIFTPTDAQLELRGIVAAVADGVASGGGGRIAAELSVREFIDAYYQLPETLGTVRVAHRALDAINRWIHGQGRADASRKGMATTFSALILRGRSAHLVHVGDTRVYRLREGVLRRLTEDHTHEHPDMKHVLRRALGLEASLLVDVSENSLTLHDRFLLSSDGLHGVLSDPKLQALLAERTAPEEAALQLVKRALEQGSQDNVTALVIDVVSLPLPDQRSLERSLEGLPVLELPKIHDEVDSFRLEKLLSEGRYNRLFVAKDLLGGGTFVLKFPHPRVTSDATYHSAFVREAWVAGHVRSPFVGEVVALPQGRQTRLYSVMPYYEGETLEQRLRRRPPVSLEEGVDIGTKLAKAIYTLHRGQIIHRDIKPENMVVLRNGDLRLLDLGVALLPGFPELMPEEIPGTPSYMAPELFAGEPGSERSDVFALGVTLYRMWSAGHFPYGEIEAFSRPRFSRYTPLHRYRPDLPAWLDRMLAAATAIDTHERMADTIAVAFDLEHGLARGGQVRKRTVPILERDPVLLWKLISLLLASALLATLLWTGPK